MPVFNLTDVAGTLFPAGRLTRVLVGPGAPAELEKFVAGHVTIYPGGEVPGHAHEQEEMYFIISGDGIMELSGEKTAVGAGSYAVIAPQQWHCLRNSSQENLVMLFCYAPKGIVGHWQQELQGTEEDK